ncbi:esterase/lipase family protein [Amycolatopsis echigonensis]|uniref:Triacylglycerol esterase/lipase EstA (Alpha/beta hydrolase family) n=1 Tax=Amycolatopsis echigonensis TaxID=2576905 RepID=A0A2N3WN79_9PSEU|nr:MULTISPECIES: hypothetical protein [Amycolatopsis]MBB2503875.1 hypothetical protein [Amycolatopsis echigonensis]PKV95326.1 triacylglycerol esterase/lipase EstA (alpha/beta hydrolase family) [Amycolatopsis niigatensis]
MAKFVLATLFTALVSALITVPASAASGPVLQEPTSSLSQALSCSADVSSPAKTPVILVHGTFTTPEETWRWGYQRALRTAGYPVCTVQLPHRAEIDMQVSVEYVVHAIRSVYSSAERKVSVIGHSQGGGLIPWALRFWPDLAAEVDDAIALSGPQDGTRLANGVCVPGRCPDVAHQLSAGSKWMRALVREPLDGVAFTSIGSYSDEVVFPAPTATRFPGATDIFVQDVCPDRLVGHLGMLSDAVAYALVADALTHAGPAMPARVAASTCFATDLPGLDQAGRARLLNTAVAAAGAFYSLPCTPSEPPLRDYALAG